MARPPVQRRESRRSRQRTNRLPRAVLPSGLSPSAPESHRVHRSMASTGSRAVGRAAESPPVRNCTDPASAWWVVVPQHRTAGERAQRRMDYEIQRREEDAHSAYVDALSVPDLMAEPPASPTRRSFDWVEGWYYTVTGTPTSAT